MRKCKPLCYIGSTEGSPAVVQYQIPNEMLFYYLKPGFETSSIYSIMLFFNCLKQIAFFQIFLIIFAFCIFLLNYDTRY